jgi:hypothetical protein
MVNTAGLRLDQAPPIHLPLRLLLTAPWFAVAAAVLLMVSGGEALASRWTPAALAMTHLIVIGFLGQAMCGALLQMLPVIAGAPVPGVHWVATLVHLALGAGAALLAAGLLGGGPWPLALGAGGATLGFAVFLAALTVALTRAQGAPATLLALRLAAFSLAVTVIIGATLASALLGWTALPGLPAWIDLHLAWGLFGWVGLLILGVAYQVVPMFHITPAYPATLARWLAPVLFAALVIAGLGTLTDLGGIVRLAQGAIALGFGAFALVTLDLQRRRSRPRRDATLLHWWSAMASAIAAAFAWGLGAPDTLVGVLLLVGVGVGLPSGMLLKIVPFLCWFHLQQRQVSAGRFEVRVPHMHGFLPARLARWQWALHLGALTTLAAACAEPRLAPALAPTGGLLLALASLLLAGLLLTSAWRYRGIRKSLEGPVPLDLGPGVRARRY